MSARQMWRRLAKVEELFCPKHDDGQYTLEELCRAIWQQDARAFRKMVDLEYCTLRYFIPQFEREDLARR
jgi:hypothetical protein